MGCPRFASRTQSVLLSFFSLSLAFDVMKQTQGGHVAYRSRAHRHPAHPPHTRRTRARPTSAGRKGSDSLGLQVEIPRTPCARTQGKCKPDGSQATSCAPSSPSTALNTSAPSLPTHPPRAISRNLGAPRHATPPHPTSPTAAPRYLGRSRSVARAASHLLKKGRGSRGRARSVLAASSRVPKLRAGRCAGSEP